MGLILAGILAAAICLGIMVVCMLCIKNEMIAGLIMTVPIFATILSLLGGCALGIFSVVNGYGEPQIVSTTKLVGLRAEDVSESTDRLFYVSILGTNSYTYYVEVDSTYASNSQNSYNSNTISDSNVTIVEDDSYIEAKLVTYVRHGKKSFWTFAVGAKKYEYVFYVPTGTIARDDGSLG